MPAYGYLANTFNVHQDPNGNYVWDLTNADRQIMLWSFRSASSRRRYEAVAYASPDEAVAAVKALKTGLKGSTYVMDFDGYGFATVTNPDGMAVASSPVAFGDPAAAKTAILQLVDTAEPVAQSSGMVTSPTPAPEPDYMGLDGSTVMYLVAGASVAVVFVLAGVFYCRRRRASGGRYVDLDGL